MPAKRVLIINSNENFYKRLENCFLDNNFYVFTVDMGVKAIQMIKNKLFDLVVLSSSLPDISGLKLISRIKEIYSNVIIIVVSEKGSVLESIRAIKLGADDYIAKAEHSFDDFCIKIVRSAKRILSNIDSKGAEKDHLNSGLSGDGIFIYDDIIGVSKKMVELFKLLEKIASLPSTILIEGESGTGKNLIARAIHSMSDRKESPFVTVSCPAIPMALLESELFGHEKGAFSGAVKTKIGLFEKANGGTLFLDEIGTISPDFQVKLLRVIQEKKVHRVGSVVEIPLDIRIISSTNADLYELVKSGVFREDLYYRLNVIKVVVPPLRERKEDIPYLLNHFLKKYSNMFNKKFKGFSDSVIKLLQAYHWPGNVRELENLVTHTLAVTDEKEIIEEKDIPNIDELKMPKNSVKIFITSENYYKVRESFEKAYLKNILETCNFNITEASKMSGLSRQWLYKKIRKYGVMAE